MGTIAAIAALTLLAALAGGGLGALARRTTPASNGNNDSTTHNPDQRLTEQINAVLPQLQCGDCGYPGCRPYAAALAANECGIDLCTPGGDDTMQRLATLLNVPATPMPTPPPRRIAVVNTDDCVGCALCLPACPTDAIIGAPRHAHVVIATHCVGCELCLPPCPVDCIRMVNADDARAV